MSKQSEAKAAQGYTTEPHNCGNCAHRSFDLELPAWMRASSHEYDDRYLLEKNQRCGIGGFAVKKTATCTQWKCKSSPTPEPLEER